MDCRVKPGNDYFRDGVTNSELCAGLTRASMTKCRI